MWHQAVGLQALVSSAASAMLPILAQGGIPVSAPPLKMLKAAVPMPGRASKLKFRKLPTLVWNGVLASKSLSQTSLRAHVADPRAVTAR